MQNVTFEKAIEVILSHEGQYSSNPADQGSETNWGISKRAYPDIDIKRLTRSGAIAIYKKDYWTLFRIETYPDNIRLQMFDMTVNMGSKNAIRMLQRSLNRYYYDLTVDGDAGAHTMAALKEVSDNESESRTLPYFLCMDRLIYYSNLVAGNPRQIVFLKGWTTRANAVFMEGLK